MTELPGNATFRAMARCKFLVVLSFAFVVAVTSVAQATAIDPEQAAKQAYARGAELFKNRHFTEAAAAFEEGNQLKPHPAFSYNLALTYRALGQPARRSSTTRAICATLHRRPIGLPSRRRLRKSGSSCRPPEQPSPIRVRKVRRFTKSGGFGLLPEPPWWRSGWA